MQINTVVKSINARLKRSGVSLSIGVTGARLWLRGTLPNKNGDGGKCQQRIYLGIPATIAGLQLAESEALKIDYQLKSGAFSWEPYLKEVIPQSSAPKTTGQWIQSFEMDYFQKRTRTSSTILTWEKDYLATFRKLNWEAPLTPESIKETILNSPPDTRVRKRCCVALGALAKFAGVEIDVNQWSGRYSPKSVTPRNIPTDRVITQCYQQISSPPWRWVYGMIATYGLRNHEVFRVDFNQIKRGTFIITVTEGKTGYRRVYPIYPEWFYEFNLQRVELPSVNLSNANHSLGHTVSQQFRRSHLPFTAYDLRHAWAIRSLLFGLDVSLASQMMGHSLKVHHDTYHQWISERHYEQAFKLLMSREDRPKPP